MDELEKLRAENERLRRALEQRNEVSFKRHRSAPLPPPYDRPQDLVFSHYDDDQPVFRRRCE